MCTCPPPRFRQTQTKSKKDSKLDLFGFEDAVTHQEDDSGDNTEGGSSYKIKYFGFDDMSDSDGADDGEEEGSKEKRRVKKAAPAKVVAVEETVVVEPPDPFERLEIQERPAAKESKKNSERPENRSRAGENTRMHTRAHTHTHCCDHLTSVCVI